MTYGAGPLTNEEYHYVKADTNTTNVYDAIADTTVAEDTAIYSLADGNSADDNDRAYPVAGNAAYLASTDTNTEYSHLNRVI